MQYLQNPIKQSTIKRYVFIVNARRQIQNVIYNNSKEKNHNEWRSSGLLALRMLAISGILEDCKQKSIVWLKKTESWKMGKIWKRWLMDRLESNEVRYKQIGLLANGLAPPGLKITYTGDIFS